MVRCVHDERTQGIYSRMLQSTAEFSKEKLQKESLSMNSILEIKKFCII